MQYGLEKQVVVGRTLSDLITWSSEAPIGISRSPPRPSCACALFPNRQVPESRLTHSFASECPMNRFPGCATHIPRASSPPRSQASNNHSLRRRRREQSLYRGKVLSKKGNNVPILTPGHQFKSHCSLLFPSASSLSHVISELRRESPIRIWPVYQTSSPLVCKSPLGLGINMDHEHKKG